MLQLLPLRTFLSTLTWMTCYFTYLKPREQISAALWDNLSSLYRHRFIASDRVNIAKAVLGCHPFSFLHQPKTNSSSNAFYDNLTNRQPTNQLRPVKSISTYVKRHHCASKLMTKSTNSVIR